MDITYFGFNSVRIRGKKTTLIIDPFSKEQTGIRFEKTEADAVLLTRKNANELSTDKIENFRVRIDGPGEYEVGGVSVLGIKLGAVTTYYIKMDGVALLCLGNLSQTFSDGELDTYPYVDILFVQASSDIARLIAKLEPKVVVPFYDKESLPQLLKELGREEVKPMPKLTIKKESLPSELAVVVLE